MAGDVTMIDAADKQTHSEAEKQSHSEADLATIGDVVVWNQMPHLPARRLIQLNCERWSVWHPSHLARIVEARRPDDSRDWYFPIITKAWVRRAGELVPSELCWTWSGIWHESADHAHTERALTLPPMSYLRQDWRYVSFMLYQVAASEGGLLLLWSRRVSIPGRRSPRLKHSAAEKGAEINVPGASTWRTVNGSDYYREIDSPTWTRLLVCNPLTKEYRELPKTNGEEIGWPSWRLAFYHGTQVRMVVDDEANSYQVIMLLKEFVAVYKSTTNSWTCLRFPQERPWHRRRFSPWMFRSAAVRVGGRIYLADVKTRDRHPRATPAGSLNPVSEPTPVGALRLFEVDAEAGTWHLVYEYTLRKFHLPVLNQYPECFPFDMGLVDNVELVGCMGDLYAVVPARLHDVVTMGQKQTPHWKSELQDFGTHRRLKRKNRRSLERKEPCELARREVGVKYMPLVFYVMQLRAEDGLFGEGVDHAVLRMTVPKNRNSRTFPDYMARKQRMYNSTDMQRSGGANWFGCEARGSVIWVSYEDYLLSYDVVSRKSTMQMIPVHSGEDCCNQVNRLAYKPNFHVKP